MQGIGTSSVCSLKRKQGRKLCAFLCPLRVTLCHPPVFRATKIPHGRNETCVCAEFFASVRKFHCAGTEIFPLPAFLLLIPVWQSFLTAHASLGRGRHAQSLQYPRALWILPPSVSVVRGRDNACFWDYEQLFVIVLQICDICLICVNTGWAVRCGCATNICSAFVRFTNKVKPFLVEPIWK